MNYSLPLVWALPLDLDASHGNGELDRLSDYMLRDIGLKRAGGRIVDDDIPEEDQRLRPRGWSWSTLGEMVAHPLTWHRSAPQG